MHILITGANRGIGRALSETYTQRGDKVIATARGDAPAGAPGRWEQLDVTAPESHAALGQRLAGEALDLLVCNAGVYPDKGQRLEDGYPPAMWADAFCANVTGVFLTIQTLLPNLRAGRGKIAIISSQMASDTTAPGGSYIYRASKAAVLNLGRNLAADLAPEGIAVGIYHPGWVRTDMGGPSGQIDVETAAQGLIARFDELGPATTGCFQTWDGCTHPY